MPDQAHHWSRAAVSYEKEFIDPYLPSVRNPLRQTLAGLLDTSSQTVADLGCGIGPLLPFLAERFQRVVAVDFAEGMLQRAREICANHRNVEFLQRSFTDLQSLDGQVDVAVAVNSLVLPKVGDLEKSLSAIHDILKPGGRFLGIVPAMDGVHYFTMLLLDRARQVGMPEAKARLNAAHHAEHLFYDFAFGDFRYHGLHQHFWQPFEVRYRLRRAGFRKIHLAKVHLAWEQFGCATDLKDEAPPWDWFFHALRQWGPAMREVAPDVWLLDGYPLDAFNVYLAENILIDAGMRWDRYRLLRQLRGRKVTMVALTHCHPDHQGIAALVCKKYGVPLACHEADVAAMEGREPMWPHNWILKLGHWAWSGPPYPVQRVLRDGDRVGNFRVVHTPGHTPGHVVYFRESDGVAIVGDVITNVHFLTASVVLCLPPPLFSADPEQNRRSLRLLVGLRPSVVCFGHGPPLYDLKPLEEYLAKIEKRASDR